MDEKTERDQKVASVGSCVQSLKENLTQKYDVVVVITLIGSNWLANQIAENNSVNLLCRFPFRIRQWYKCDQMRKQKVGKCFPDAV